MAFNRLHLAQALLEYDNDDPSAGYAPRNAKDSIMFKALERARNMPPAHRDDPRKSWVTQREPPRPSIDDDGDEGEDKVEAGQVNLASWDLPKDFISEGSPERGTPGNLVNHTASAIHSTNVANPTETQRRHSGHLDSLADDAVEEIRALSPGIRETIDSLPSTEPTVGEGPGARTRTRSFDTYGSVLAEAERVRRLVGGADDDHAGRMVSPTPSAPILRDLRSSSYSDAALESRPRTMFERESESGPSRERRLSSSSLVAFPVSPPNAQRRSTMSHPQHPDDLEELDEDVTPNPFALPPPPEGQVSRFDPKAAAAARPRSRNRHHSHGSMTSLLSGNSRALMDRAGAGARATVLDKHGRPVSTFDSEPSNRATLLDKHGRPVSSYQTDTSNRATLLDKHGHPVDTPESPPGRSPGVLYNRRSLLFPKVLVMPTPLQPSLPVDNSEATFRDGFKVGEKPLPPGARPLSLFPASTSNKRLSTMSSMPRNMTLSQQVFRSSLLVGGQRDDAFIGGAIQDGDVGWQREDDDDYDDDDPRKGVGKPVGALYGTSLMDQLEARKKALKSKQRVFAGDARPSMMARNSSSDRRSTLIDPESLNMPLTEATSPQGRSMNRQRLPHSKSVFGVDEVWEKEVAKLKIIEERERAALEAEEEKERAKAARREKRGKKSRKGKERAVEPENEKPSEDFADPEISPVNRLPDLPPTLLYSPEKASIPIYRDGDDDDESHGARVRSASKLSAAQWGASSDEDDDSGGRSRRRAPKATAPVEETSSSEDEVPLSKQFNLPPRPKTVVSEESSDEDVPLSRLVPASRPVQQVNSDDDDVPLGLHHPAPPQNEDDLPLGMQHRSVAQMQYLQQMQLQMAIQQQQQEMFMRQSMFMPSPGIPFPAFDPYAMAPPHQPQVQAAGIDRWRREVPMAPSATASSVGGRR